MFSDSFAFSERLTAEVDGITFTATIEHDDFGGRPWENEDGHGPVEWAKPNPWGSSRAKRAGVMLLTEPERGGGFWAYDFAEACKIALRDGWGVEGGRKEGETAKAYAARAAMADFKRLRAWCRDEWSYCVVNVKASASGVELASDSLGGIETDAGDYLDETANELAEGLIEEAKANAARIAERLAGIAA